MPKVSIIVPTYNRAKYLLETIISITSQDFNDFEIIISDNASTDNTAEVVKALIDDRIVYYRNQSNIGMARNHNKALEMCSGEYVHIFSDDDLMLPGCLREKVKILDEYPTVGLVHSDSYFIDTDGNVNPTMVHWGNTVWKKWAALHSHDRLFRKNEYHRYLFYIYNIISMPSVMIRKSLIERVGLMDTKLNFIIDWDYWLKITLFSDVYFINKKLISYRVHPTNITKKMSNKALVEEINYIKSSVLKSFPNSSKLRTNRLLDILQEGWFYSDYNYLRIVRFIFKKFISSINGRKKFVAKD